MQFVYISTNVRGSRTKKKSVFVGERIYKKIGKNRIKTLDISFIYVIRYTRIDMGAVRPNDKVRSKKLHRR